MNADVSERAFEDAIEAALLRCEGMVAEEQESDDGMGVCCPADIQSVATRITAGPSVSSHMTCWTLFW